MPYPWTIIPCSEMFWSARVGADNSHQCNHVFKQMICKTWVYWIDRHPALVCRIGQRSVYHGAGLTTIEAAFSLLPIWKSLKPLLTDPWELVFLCLVVAGIAILKDTHKKKKDLLGMVGLTQNTLRKVNSMPNPQPLFFCRVWLWRLPEIWR